MVKTMSNTTEKFIFLETVDSTNTYAKNNFDLLEDGTLVVAGTQSAGRGRLGRPWVSPPGVNIYASFVMKNCLNPFGATQVLSLGALRMLRTLPGAEKLPLWIKWPNDLYCGDRKLAGVLCEGVLSRHGVIAGIGINLNLPSSKLEKISQPAISMLAATGIKYNLKKSVVALDKSIKECYIIYNKCEKMIFDEWKSNNFLIGHRVKIDNGRECFFAQVEDIAPDGQLQVSCDNRRFNLSCGDVSIVKDSIDFAAVLQKSK